jgi:hypothetical protein
VAGRLRDRRAWGGLLISGALTIALTLPFLLPYVEVQRRFAFERPFGEVLAFSANVWSYATAAEPVHLWGRLLRLHPHGEGETAPTGGRRRVAQLLTIVFVLQGLAFLSTVLVGGFNLRILGVPIRASTPVRLLVQTLLPFGLLLMASRRWRTGVARLSAQPVAGIVALLLLAVWLSLGPAPSAGPWRVSGLGLYDVLYTHVPGFTGVRVPARYAMVAGVFLAVAAGFGALRLLRWRHGPALLAVGSLLILADAAAMPLAINHTWGTNEATPPARVYPRDSAPAVYQALRALPAGTVVAEFPFGDSAWEIRAVYYAAVHGQRVLNGYSGAFPPGYRRRVAALGRFDVDGQTAWDALVEAGTTHVVVHTPAFANPNRARGLLVWLQSRGARLVSSYPDGDALFALPR